MVKGMWTCTLAHCGRSLLFSSFNVMIQGQHADSPLAVTRQMRNLEPYYSTQQQAYNSPAQSDAELTACQYQLLPLQLSN